MKSHAFRYQILRYVPDLLRHEPQNVGIIVQSEMGVSCRFIGCKERTPGFDVDNYRLWLEYFASEILGPPVPHFQPPKESREFFGYLRSRCRGNYNLTSPLELALESPDLKVAESYLYETLVRPLKLTSEIISPCGQGASATEPPPTIKG